MGEKLDTRAIGLDVGLSFIRWLTGAENLHYGLWTGLDVRAENLGRAQAAYTERLFSHLPEGPLGILDVGGGAGETAARLTARGHDVEIVVPSAFLAARCRENAPAATVHEMRFQDFRSDRRFDLVLFSESFQYIPRKEVFDLALALLAPGGEILIADCFRSDAYTPNNGLRSAGGGHPISEIRPLIARKGLAIVAEEDITEGVAPSIDLEQALFNVFGHGIKRVDAELSEGRPRIRWLLRNVLRLVLGRNGLESLTTRLMARTRTAERFCRDNRYMIFRLRPEV
jgi:SAM-dependent methyltransferase